jgi:hypothetical protein
VNGGILQRTGNIFEGKRPTRWWQDKQPPGRLTAKREEPATAENPAVGSKGGSATAVQPIPPAVNRPTHHGSETRQTGQVTGRVPYHIKAGLLQVAKANNWTESKIVAVACEAYLEQDLGEKFGVRLASQVVSAMRREFQAQNNRQAYLSVQGYYAAEESRIINTKVLHYLFGQETEIYNQIVSSARKEARDNIRRQIEEK